MKKLFLVTVASLLTCGAAVAQTEVKKESKEVTHQKHDDCVMMEKGKMMVMKDGKTMPMDKEMKMKNGTTVKPDGTCITKDGKKTMMKEGDMMDMNGDMMPMMKEHKGMKHEEEHKK